MACEVRITLKPLDDRGGCVTAPAMPSVTLRDLPPDLHAQLKQQAEANYRSLILCLLAARPSATQATVSPVSASIRGLTLNRHGSVRETILAVQGEAGVELLSRCQVGLELQPFQHGAPNAKRIWSRISSGGAVPFTRIK